MPRYPVISDIHSNLEGLQAGSPRDEDEYLDDLTITEMPSNAGGSLIFAGHTHVQGGYAVRDGVIRRLGRRF